MTASSRSPLVCGQLIPGPARGGSRELTCRYSSGSEENASAEEVKFGPTVAGAFDELDPGRLAFDLAGAPRARQAGDDRVPAVEEPVGELP